MAQIWLKHFCVNESIWILFFAASFSLSRLEDFSAWESDTHERKIVESKEIEIAKIAQDNTHMNPIYYL